MHLPTRNIFQENIAQNEKLYSSWNKVNNKTNMQFGPVRSQDIPTNRPTQRERVKKLRHFQCKNSKSVQKIK